MESFEAEFRPVMGGVFMARQGPAKDEVAKSNKKLCLVATNKDLLIQTLAELSERPDCYFVKYSTMPKDGMYLGRCFLTSASAVGELWYKLKQHPNLMCTVQDDDFTIAFREPA